MTHKKKFVEFLFRHQVILLGDFTTKSQRRTPYFFNFGQLYTGTALYNLGNFYAKRIWEGVVFKEFPEPTVIFGPAYKGIPLSVATTIGLRLRTHGNIAYAFNRKEIKDHGDGGIVVGKPLERGDRVVVIDDVVTSGISIGQSIQLIQERFQAQVVGVVVAVDREESADKTMLVKNQSPYPLASECLSQTYGVPVKSILSLTEMFTLAKEHKFISLKKFEKVMNYLKTKNEKN